MNERRNIEMVRKYSRGAHRMIKKSYKIIFVSVFLILAFAVTNYTTYKLGHLVGAHEFRSYVNAQLENVSGKEGITQTKQEIDIENVDFAPFWDAWILLERNFANGANSTSTEEATDQEHVWGAIQGLTASYNDPFTTFLPPEEKEFFDADISGEFTGVGMEIGRRNGVLTVISPLPGTPADRAGIQPKDIISKINEKDAIEMSATQAVKLIRGPKGEEVTLTVLREGAAEPLEITITRDTIKIPTIDSQVVDDVYVIKLFSFTSQAARLFAQELKAFEKSPYDKLVLDFRGNPGGYLQAAVDIASRFLDKDKLIVTEQYSNKELTNNRYSYGYDEIASDTRVVVLINEGSASASEIVAGALRDHEVALLLGQTSFGKGSVQELFPLTQDTALKITIAKWLTPSGTHISQNGITPDIEIDIENNNQGEGTYSQDFSQDEEIVRAVEIITRNDFEQLFKEIPEELQTANTNTDN